MLRLALVVFVVASFLAGRASADVFNVKTFGATPNNDADDDAPAFRAAINASNAAGGGTVYVPSGSYMLKTGSGPTYILLLDRGTKLSGDAGGAESDNGTSGIGSVIRTNSPSLSVINLYSRLTNTSNPVIRVDGCIIENLKISRTVPPSDGACGIEFGNDGAPSGSAEPSPTTINNVILEGHDIGIGLRPTSTALISRTWTSVRINNCISRLNRTYGGYFEDFRNLHVTSSTFVQNGRLDSVSSQYIGAGFAVRTFTPIEQAGQVLAGSAFFSGCSFTSNSGVGLSIRGEQTFYAVNLAENIHVTGCVFGSNQLQGFAITQSRNVQIASCTVTRNRGASANFIGACTGVSVIGCTFSLNDRRGLYIASSKGITVASCAFESNSRTSATDFAIVVLAGSSHSYSNLTFSGSANQGPQQRGISLSGNGDPAFDPTGILMQGLNFEGGMTIPFTISQVTASAKIRVDFMSPQNWTATFPFPTLSNGLHTYFQ